MSKGKQQPQLDRALNGPAPSWGSLETDLARLLTTPLGSQLLGVELSADFYGQNGFRFIGTPASADNSQLESAAQKFRNLLKLNPAAAAGSCIQTGYDAHLRLEKEDIKEWLARLNNPRQRLLCELFWLHLPPDLFAPIKNERTLAAPQALAVLNETVASQNGRAGAIAAHALAVISHNQAIARELAFVSGAAEWSDEYWISALFYWANVLEADSFWDYLRERAVGWDDPRINAEDVTLVRAQLPALLLRFHTLFALAYGKAGAHGACRRHVEFIQACNLPAAVKQETLAAAVRTLADARLEPLTAQVDERLLAASDRSFTRQQFDKLCAPVLSEAAAIRRRLAEDLGFPEDLVRLAEFDRLCEKVFRASDRKLNYDSNDRVRTILYSTLLSKQMLGWPLSDEMRRKLERSLRNDTEILYRGFTPTEAVDPTHCHFLLGEEADPDASFDLPIHKIEQVRGVSVHWQSRRVLAPRSVRAKRVQSNQLTLEGVVEEWLMEGARLRIWEPPQADANEPFRFRGNTVAGNVLGLLVVYCQKPDEVLENLRNGNLATWFEYRGQHALAARCRQPENDSVIQPFVHALCLAAAMEVKAQTAVLEAECEAAVQQENQQCAAEVKREDEAARQALAQFDQRAESQTAADRRQLAEVQQSYEQQVIAENQRRNTAIAEATQRGAATVAQAEASHAQTVERFRGFRGGSRLEAPTMAAAVIVLAALGLIAGASTSGLIALLLLGLALGLGIGQMARRRPIRKAAKALGAANQAIKEEVSEIERKSQETIARLKQQAQQSGAAARNRLQAVSAEREKLVQDGARRSAAISKRSEQSNHSRKNATAARVKQLQQPLTERIKVKAESAKTEFPAYRKAKSLGFSDGEKPSDYEIERIVNREMERFLNSLDEIERIIFARVVQQVSSDQANQIMASLMEMPTWERKQKLRSFIGL